MQTLKKIGKWVLYILGFFLLTIFIFAIYVVSVIRLKDPEPAEHELQHSTLQKIGDHRYRLHKNWINKNKQGLYEMYVEGGAYERGLANGKLSQELVINQEEYFVAQIKEMIPSEKYLKFLKYLIGWFNRNLENNVKQEYREEIYGISKSASSEFEFIGSNYQRILNYHAAHDIGHALQNLALVGCSSFATWDDASEDGSLIIGRNFDFYVGDDFARDKIILFENPAKGYKFMSVTWGGFVGVVSGMNEKGLTVTINAAKSGIPSGSATPVSLVAREVLQYASNIEEAIAIAQSRKMFVSESFLVGSAKDKKAIIIEKTPDRLDVYDPQSNQIVCTNHFQSKGLSVEMLNQEQLQESASVYRYQRLKELMQGHSPNTVENTVAILRDRRGLDGRDIGMGNEKALNQLIAHHGIVFKPEKLQVWVSSNPWQLGEFVAYDLNTVFNMDADTGLGEINDTALTIPVDPFMQTTAFTNFLDYQQLSKKIKRGESVNLDSFVLTNPQLYHTYVIAGRAAAQKKDKERALRYFKLALTKEIATKQEEWYINEQIAELEKPQQ